MQVVFIYGYDPREAESRRRRKKENETKPIQVCFFNLAPKKDKEEHYVRTDYRPLWHAFQSWGWEKLRKVESIYLLSLIPHWPSGVPTGINSPVFQAKHIEFSTILSEKPRAERGGDAGQAWGQAFSHCTCRKQQTLEEAVKGPREFWSDA